MLEELLSTPYPHPIYTPLPTPPFTPYLHPIYPHPPSYLPQVCPSFDLQRVNSLELTMLEELRYFIKVSAGEYAKYYFLLRSMTVKLGMGQGLGTSPGSPSGGWFNPLLLATHIIPSILSPLRAIRRYVH